MDEETQVKHWNRIGMLDIARRAGLWISVLTLGVAVAMFLIAANQMIDIWFRYQYVPIARMVIAVLIAGGAVAVIWRLTSSAKA